MWWGRMVKGGIYEEITPSKTFRAGVLDREDKWWRESEILAYVKILTAIRLRETAVP